MVDEAPAPYRRYGCQRVHGDEHRADYDGQDRHHVQSIVSFAATIRARRISGSAACRSGDRR
jgi:hypothetical protein